MRKTQELLDQFATAALTALIAKQPFIDRDGDYGKQMSEQEMMDFKKDIALSAYEYAQWMMIARDKSKDWLIENDAVINR